MILSTMNDLPGYEVTEVIGEVFGITVRSRHAGSQIGAGFKSLVGGEGLPTELAVSYRQNWSGDRFLLCLQGV